VEIRASLPSRIRTLATNYSFTISPSSTRLLPPRPRKRHPPELSYRPRLRSTNDSWRVDETYIRVKGKWDLYRAVDSTGATIDFLLSAKRDAAAAERFLAKALGGENHPALRGTTGR
jgi:DDE domain